MDCLNSSDVITNDSAEELEARDLFESTRFVAYTCLVPVIAVVGVFGNVLNLLILSLKRRERHLYRLERNANLCLTSLAVSDLMFCLTAAPSAILPKDDNYHCWGFLLYYRLYSPAVISVFIMSSVFLTVTMSMERYLAICHPMRKDLYLTTKRTRAIILATFLASVLFNLPILWRYSTKSRCSRLEGRSEEVVIVPVMLDLLGSRTVDMAYRVLWAVSSNFLPFLLLLFFNVSLWRDIWASHRVGRVLRTHSGSKPRRRSPNQVMTMTLFLIVAMFFILVTPSELAVFIGQVTHTVSFRTATIEIIMNVLQATNFALNFVLYCIVDPYFRRTLKALFCGCQLRSSYSVTVKFTSRSSTTTQSISTLC